MKRSTVFILLAVAILSAGIAAGAFVVRLVNRRKAKTVEVVSSDAAKLKESVRLAGDSWIGYAPFRSDMFERFLGAEGIGLRYTDDKADYAARMERLNRGEYDAIATTLDAYLINARRYNYPGVIAFVIDESKGGDAIVATKDVASLADLTKSGVKIALTPNSPSDFLLRSVATHFDLTTLQIPGSWRVETDGSADALKKLQAGAVQAAVLWEPDVTEATSDQRFRKLLGTEKTEGLILDVCVLRRQFVVEKPQVAQAFVLAWFRTLKHYQTDKDAFVGLVAQDARTDKAKAAVMLQGLGFASLAKNLNWWYGVAPLASAPPVDGEPGAVTAPGGLGREQLLVSIRAVSAILQDSKLLPADGLGEMAPRQLVNSSFLETIRRQGLQRTDTVFKGDGDTAAGAAAANAGVSAFAFKPLDDAGWKSLKTLGTLKTRPVVFQSGTPLLTLEGKQAIDRMAEDLALYPSYRVLVRGHTSPDGDAEENVRLSKERADTVSMYLQRVHQIPETRLRVEGVGGTLPLPRAPDESDRRWKGRLSRVELLLVEDPSVE